MKDKINIIVALDKNGGFSKNGKIPWLTKKFAKADLKRFKEITNGHTVIMGRLTYEDIHLHAKSKGLFKKNKTILPNRECIVLTKNEDYDVDNFKNVTTKTTLRKAIEHASKLGNDIFVIGGESVFIEALSWNLNKIYVTYIDDDYKCDKFFPISVFNKRFRIESGLLSGHDVMKFIEYVPKHI